MLAPLLAILSLSLAAARPTELGQGVTPAVESRLSHKSFAIRARQTNDRYCDPGYGACPGGIYCAPLGSICCGSECSAAQFTLSLLN